MSYINIARGHVDEEHICCAIADKKHQRGVDVKKEWLKARIPEGHVFRKLDERGKVFIEYSPLETAWVPVLGDNYLYIYCLWVSGNFKGKGHGKTLLEYCIGDAKKQNKSGVCAISSRKKKPFLIDSKFMLKHGFEIADTIGGEYVLVSLSFDGSKPCFTEAARKHRIDSKDLTIYYGLQCPYIPNCVKEIEAYCQANGVKLNLIKVDTLKKAKSLPCVFNNWAVFYDGKFETVHLLNEGYLQKMLAHKHK